MADEIGKLSDLADVILLDDISDVFYRSIVFPFIVRTELDPVSDQVAQFDEKLQKRLGRHLYWADALITLDPKLQLICIVATAIHKGQYSVEMLNQDRQRDFWLDKAIQDVFNDKSDSATVITQIVDVKTGYLGSTKLRQLVWHYLGLNSVEPCASIQTRVEELTLDYRDLAIGIAEKDGVKLDHHSLESIVLLHALPMLALLKLYEQSLTKLSIEYNKLHREPFEPTAESLLDFLKFDEFIRPHVMESLGLSEALVPSLLNIKEPKSTELKYFLLGRNAVIKNLLAGNHVLTVPQIQKLESQMGIEPELKESIEDSFYKKFISRLLSKR